ncbi:peptidase M76 family-domain-containing protein [Crepidotus variabilis]|uniref:Mitochondrial inner membrane protease ATP23 n=1 Tax=Crepidotus variabilis TaxID=179855 RepID=A0A9P6E5H6_9AGAR|nr:peptidase M76 family-domain-containing protein [Crepidotus variabilis]
MSEPTSSSNSTRISSANEPETTSAFEKWRRKAMLVTGLGVSEDERLANLQASHMEHCEKRKEDLMNTSPLLGFMMKHLKLAGCDVPPSNILCAPCDMTKAGGFSPDPGAVILCGGHFFSKQHMESTIAHELLHLYDHCRFKVDWSNLRHHACSEIRANNLSGDCRFTRELRRGVVAFSKQHQACVRRRAVESVMANPACPNQETAERAVNEVWESCFNDTRPFDEIY